MLASEAIEEPGSSLVGRVLLGRYRIVRPLARGGMGVVYLGRVEGSAGFSKPVVVKSVITTLGADKDGELLFAREARIVANLQHPGIVGVIDFGRVDNTHVMVLEYVHGFHLGQWLRWALVKRGSVAVEQAVYVVLCVLDALAYAHALTRPDGSALGVVHRDISPANVLIDMQGHVKLGDFGIARTADDEFKTQQGLFRGTLPYSAPESLQGVPPSPKVDQHACAVVLYQLLSGKNPLRGLESPETVARVLTFVPPPLSTVRGDVPPGIDLAIARALSKDPADRFDTTADFARALRDGATWSERDAGESFVRQIEQDFTDDMAQALNLESLAVRDASWREAQEAPRKSVSLSSSPPGMRSGIIEHQTIKTEVTPQALLPAQPAATVQPTRRIGPSIVLGAVIVGGLVTLAIYGVGRSTPAPAARVLVIEKQAIEPAQVTTPAEKGTQAPAAASPEPALEPSATAAPAAAPSPRGAPVNPGENRAATLARAFQRQGSKIERCYQQDPETAKSDAHISVRFQIDKEGKVQAATVSPASVAATALGSCLAEVARATSFGPQPDPLSFAIPIAARVVRR